MFSFLFVAVHWTIKPMGGGAEGLNGLFTEEKNFLGKFLNSITRLCEIIKFIKEMNAEHMYSIT